MSGRRVRSLARLGAALAILAVLVGCVRIPMTGEVSTIQIAIDDGREELLPVPEGPVAGASAREILIGFLRAGRGPQNVYAVAREYLTDDFRGEWSPTAGVLISSTAVAPVETEDGGYRVELEVAAEVDSHGRYELAGPGRSRNLDFTLVQEDGEWRISSAPDGTVLSPTFFDRLFDPVRLYYFDPDYRFLVPELRWFLDTRAIANRIVDELIAGESSRLDAKVVITAFPSGTSRLDPVDIDAGRASVTLSAELLAESPAAQWRMLQQLTASVLSLSDVRSVSIVSGGFPVTITPSGESADSSPQVDPIPVGLLDGRFGSIGEQEVRPLESLGDVVDGLGARAASVARDRESVAVLSSAGVSRVSAAGTIVADPGSDRIPPSIDPWGYIWTGPRDSLGDLVAIGADGVAAPVGIGIEGRVITVQVSRDGTRALLAVETGSGPRVIVAGIVRDDGNVPTALVEPTILESGSGELLDATWVDAITVAFLSRTGSATAVTTATLGGRLGGLGSLADGAQIVGGNGVEGLRVRTSDGAVYRPSGESNWLDTGLRASFLATQQ